MAARRWSDDPEPMRPLIGRPGGPIRVVIVDDHAAIRLGLKSAIAARPGLVCVGVASNGEELDPLLYRTRPDVVILDYHLPRTDGLLLCRRIKADVPSPAVLLYSAYADPALVVPAVIAGADGIVHKAAPARELFEAIHTVASGGTHLPALIPELLSAARAAVDAEDRPIFDLLTASMPRSEIHARTGLSAGALDDRVDRMLARLRVPVGRPTAGASSTR